MSDSDSSCEDAIDPNESCTHAQLFHAMLEHASCGVMFVDSQNRICYWNKNAELIFGVTAESFPHDKTAKACASLPNRASARSDSDEAVLIDRIQLRVTADSNNESESAEPFQVDREFFCVTIGGENWLLVKFSKYEPRAFKSQSEKELLHLSRTDHLSQLLNRRGFQISLEENLHRQLALAIIDVDHFKRINDLQGHEIGDQAIQWIAGRINKHFPDAICLGRLGGDEFGVVVELHPKDSFQSISHVFETFCTNVANDQPAWYLDGIQISIGVAIAKEGSLTAQTLLSAADKAMYQSKRGGRNQSTAVWVSLDKL